MSATEAGLVTGYTGSRISVLRGDPAFEELIAHYTSVKGETVVDLQERMAQVALDATAVLQDRLEDTPEAFDAGELHDLIKLTADRTGNGPKSTVNHNVNVNLGDRLRAARERVAAPAQPSPELERSRDAGGLSHEGSPARMRDVSPGQRPAPMIASTRPIGDPS